MHKKIALIRNILASNFTRLKSPYKITFALTYKCNLKCKICKIWQNPPQREVSIEAVEKIFSGIYSEALGELSCYNFDLKK